MVKVAKKLFTMSVVAMTILWSVGVAAFIPTAVNAVDCPELEAGDLFKVPGNSAVYLLNADMERMYFPNAEVYKTWYADYSGVVEIPTTCVDAYPAPSVAPYGVNYRPGSRLVKVQISNSVYAVTPNNTKVKIGSEEVAKALYGDKWASIVRDIADVYWPNLVNTGSEITTAALHDGMLVKSGDTVYNVEDGKLYEVDGDLGVAKGDVRTVSESLVSDLEMASETVTAASLVENPAQTTAGHGTGDSTAPETGVFSVSLSANTPSSTSVPANGSRIPFTTVNLKAGSKAAVVNTLTIKRSGLSDRTDIDKVWAERNGVRFSSQQSVNSNDEAIITFSPVLNIPAGQTITLDIVASLTGGGSGNMALGVVDGNSVVVGNLMSLVSYTVASVDLANYAAAVSPKVGDTATQLTAFDFQPDKDVYFRSIVLKNTANEDMSKVLDNVYLEKSGNVVSDSVSIDGRYLTINLKDGGLLVEKNDNVTFRVKGDVIAKEGTTNPGLTFVIAKKEDVSATEKATGFGVSFSDSFAFALNSVNITAGSVSITKKATSPSDTEVIKGAKSVLALVANVKADEAISAEGLVLEATGSGIASSSFENVKVTLNGYSLGTVTPAATMNFDSSFTLKKGDNELKVFVDVATDAASGKSIKFNIDQTTVLNGMSPEYVQSGNTVTDINGSPAGATLTVQGATLTLAKNDGYTDSREIVRGSTQNMLARFNVKAMYDNVKITSIELTPLTPANAINTGAVSNVGVFVDGTQLGSFRAYSSATFSSLNYTLNKDTTKPFEVRADFDSTSTGTVKFNLKFNFEDSRGKSGDETAVSSLTTVIENGTVVVGADASTPESGIILAKADVENTVAAFKLSAVKDSANFTELVFKNGNPVTSTADDRINTYKLYKGTTLLGEANPINGVTTFKLSDKLIVKANSSEVITLKAVLNPIDDRNNTAKTVKAYLTDYKYKGSSGAEVPVSDQTTFFGNTMEIRKTMPLFAAVTPEELLKLGADELLKFTVTADSNEDVVLTKIKFAVTGTGAASTTDYKLYDGSTQVGSTITTPDFSGINVTVGKGLIKTFTLKADISNVAKDLKVFVTLDKATPGDITWEEVFVDGGNVSTNGAYLKVLPISYGKTY